MTVGVRIADIMNRRNAPLTVAIGGHGGTGRTTLAAAIRARFRLSCTVIGDQDPIEDDPPDLTVRVIGAGARRCDVHAIDRARGPVIVVASKADLRDRPHELAAAAAQTLGVPVHPVSGLLAAATVGPGDLALLRESGAARLPDDAVRRFGVAGVRALVDEAAADPDVTVDVLTDRLRRDSGIDTVGDAIRAASGQIAGHRDDAMRAALRLAAANGAERDAAERLLAGSRA